MAAPQYRIFFDTSVYIAALLSTQGAAGELISLAESSVIQMVVSEEVIIEIDRVLLRKFPERIQRTRELLKHLSPEIAPTPSIEEIKPFSNKLIGADASILCSAHLSKVQTFVTWNTRDFMAPRVEALVGFPIVIPADGLKLFRKWAEPFLD